jgi:hypothetical protein
MIRVFPFPFSLCIEGSHRMIIGCFKKKQHRIHDAYLWLATWRVSYSSEEAGFASMNQGNWNPETCSQLQPAKNGSCGRPSVCSLVRPSLRHTEKRDKLLYADALLHRWFVAQIDNGGDGEENTKKACIAHHHNDLLFVVAVCNPGGVNQVRSGVTSPNSFFCREWMIESRLLTVGSLG